MIGVVIDSAREVNIDSAKFAEAKAEVNRAMHSAINQLIRGAEDATVTLKIHMELIKYRRRSGDDLQDVREVLLPVIKYDVQEETRSRNKTGSKITSNDEEIIFDKMSGRFYIIKSEEADGQINFFEDVE